MKDPMNNGGLAGSTGAFRNAKRLRKQKKGSSTPGRSKVARCQANPIDRYMAKRSRSYKDRNYASWCEKMKKKASA